VRMGLLGAELRPVTAGSATLKDAMNEAIRDWMENVRDTFYMIGSVAGPHPYPTMVRDFQRVIGVETKAQCLAKEGRLPTKVFACVGGGSNSIGIFHPFLEDAGVGLFGAEAAGDGLDTPRHAATLEKGSYGILHGAAEYMLQDEDGQVLPAHSISAGLDYPGVGPEHCLLKDTGRATYLGVTDDEAIAAFCHLSEQEGIIPALESAHAVALALRMKDTFESDDIVVINISGRGDKDAQEIQAILAARE
jgi:tryptophan synthase beta chain